MSKDMDQFISSSFLQTWVHGHWRKGDW